MASLTAPAPASPIVDLAEGGSDEWPRTTRVLPWLLAGFVAMLYLVPFDSVDLPIALPFDTTLDRVLLPAIVLVWLAAFAAGGPGAPRLRLGVFDLALLAFLLMVGLSIVVHLAAVMDRDELGRSIKALAALLTYILFFYVVVSTMRAGEVRPFGIFVAGLGTVLALGVIWEYRFDANPFATAAHSLGLNTNLPLSSVDVDSGGRVDPKGPTRHGMATASLLAVSLSFAVVELLRDRRLWRRGVLILVVAILFAGGLATLRKTSVLLPIAVFVSLAVSYPRALRTLATVGVVGVLSVGALAPGAFGTVTAQLTPGAFFTANSTEGRTADYSAVVTDATASPALGRGYGTFDPLRYRLLDNQYLRTLIETGLLGLGAFIAVLLTAVVLARIPRSEREHGPPSWAVLAGIVSVLVGSTLYDLLGFPAVPYMFFLLTAMAVVMTPPASSAGGLRAQWAGWRRESPVRHR